MAGDGLRGLEAELGGPAPKGLRRLDDRHLKALAEAVADARHRQAAELAAAGDKAFGHIPKLLRIPIRKLLG